MGSATLGAGSGAVRSGGVAAPLGATGVVKLRVVVSTGTTRAGGGGIDRGDRLGTDGIHLLHWGDDHWLCDLGVGAPSDRDPQSH